MNIPDEAVDAAVRALREHNPFLPDLQAMGDTPADEFDCCAKVAIEAAAPHMMAGALQQAKRLTGTELAAEYHAQQMDAVRAFDRAYPYGESEELDAENARVDVIERFATLPHYDEEDDAV